MEDVYEEENEDRKSYFSWSEEEMQLFLEEILHYKAEKIGTRINLGLQLELRNKIQGHSGHN